MPNAGAHLVLTCLCLTSPFVSHPVCGSVTVSLETARLDTLTVSIVL